MIAVCIQIDITFVSCARLINLVALNIRHFVLIERRDLAFVEHGDGVCAASEVNDDKRTIDVCARLEGCGAGAFHKAFCVEVGAGIEGHRAVVDKLTMLSGSAAAVTDGSTTQNALNSHVAVDGEVCIGHYRQNVFDVIGDCVNV